MESLFIKPQLKRKNVRKRKPAYNHTAVCVTDDAFLKTLQEEKRKGKSKKAQPTAGLKNNHQT